ncbi:hypothetical protein TEK04_08785 [Klenkia sp. LSe6-5]|uniref:DUF1127 domain-containing protein n=1 Tax=Klenkia sesuvii TaxID=3103137 RepID=A0ABU8DUT5_9ACTN
MNLNRDVVVAALHRGDRHDQARVAEHTLPRQVDTVRDRDQLEALGVDVDSRAEGGRLALRRSTGKPEETHR